jgi:hypothetical protein
MLDPLAGGIGGAPLQDRFRRLHPRGRFDADFEYRSAPEESRWYRMSVHPREIAIKLDEVPLAISFEPSAAIEVTPERIDLPRLSGQHDNGSFTVSGAIDLIGRIDADLDLAYEGRLRCPETFALLPGPLVDALEAIDFADGEGTVTRGRVGLSAPIPRAGEDFDAASWRTSYRGRIETHGASFESGIEVEDVRGVFDVRAVREPDRPTTFRLTARDVALSALDQPIDRAEARLRLTADGRTLVLEDLRGTLHGGAVSCEARVDLEDDRAYELEVNLVGVPLAPLVEDEPPSKEVIEESGDVFAGLTLSGRWGDPTARRGRGLVRMLDGRVAGVPVALQLVQILQLTIPFSGVLDYADVDFYVAGDQVSFERILFESRLGPNALLQLMGEGQMTLQGYELDTTFRSRGGVLFVRDLVGGIGDQLYLIRVTGPLRDPEASIVPLPMFNPTPEPRRTGVASVESPDE